MGLMPAGAANPFTKLDKQSVIGTLKSCSSRDPDVLVAEKQQLLAPAKHLQLLGYICLPIGAFFTITVVLAIAGMPTIIFGWWLLRFGKRNIQTVETAYEEFLTSARL